MTKCRNYRANRLVRPTRRNRSRFASTKSRPIPTNFSNGPNVSTSRLPNIKRLSLACRLSTYDINELHHLKTVGPQVLRAKKGPTFAGPFLREENKDVEQTCVRKIISCDAHIRSFRINLVRSSRNVNSRPKSLSDSGNSKETSRNTKKSNSSA